MTHPNLSPAPVASLPETLSSSGLVGQLALHGLNTIRGLIEAATPYEFPEEVRAQRAVDHINDAIRTSEFQQGAIGRRLVNLSFARR